MRLSVYIPEDKRARFKSVCAIKKISMNQVVSDLLDEWLKKNESPESPSLTKG
ncbi:MAG: hypothetical protein F6K41_24050 [Symploca sp. SIO3E6]|nr:hypothetical protein [Caldora sp. SIO3E6]